MGSGVPCTDRPGVGGAVHRGTGGASEGPAHGAGHGAGPGKIKKASIANREYNKEYLPTYTY